MVGYDIINKPKTKEGTYMADENRKDITKEGKCFIITPIGDIGSGVFRKTTGIIESVIKPVLQQIGFTDIKAAHEITELGSINTQIINRIFNDELVIANLTGNNPNVMYELCLRHVTAKPLITICEEDTKLPFDIYDNRTIFFKDDLLGANELKKELSKVLETIDYSKEYKDNPIYNGIKVGNALKNISETDTDNTSVLLQEIIRKLDGLENDPKGKKQDLSTKQYHKLYRYIISPREKEKLGEDEESLKKYAKLKYLQSGDIIVECGQLNKQLVEEILNRKIYSAS